MNSVPTWLLSCIFVDRKLNGSFSEKNTKFRSMLKVAHLNSDLIFRVKPAMTLVGNEYVNHNR